MNIANPTGDKAKWYDPRNTPHAPQPQTKNRVLASALRCTGINRYYVNTSSRRIPPKLCVSDPSSGSGDVAHERIPVFL